MASWTVGKHTHPVVSRTWMLVWPYERGTGSRKDLVLGCAQGMNLRIRLGIRWDSILMLEIISRMDTDSSTRRLRTVCVSHRREITLLKAYRNGGASWSGYQRVWYSSWGHLYHHQASVSAQYHFHLACLILETDGIIWAVFRHHLRRAWRILGPITLTWWAYTYNLVVLVNQMELNFYP